MPYEQTWEPIGIVRRFWGHVTASEIIESTVIAQADIRFDLLRYVINDFLDCNSVEMPPIDVSVKHDNLL